MAVKKEVSAALWSRIQPLLPEVSKSPHGGRPRLSDELALNGILFVLRTGSLRAYRASGGTPTGITKDDDVPVGSNGWQMTEEEWKVVYDEFQRRGFNVKRKSKLAMNMSLEKMGSGRPWSEFGPTAIRVSTLRAFWERQGHWAVLKELLRGLRAKSIPST